jgi:hypothetical protein
MGFFAVFGPSQLSPNGWQCLEPVVMGSHTEFGRKAVPTDATELHVF